jgi:RNA polymerase sigma-70 factor (ECF subfamily)
MDETRVSLLERLRGPDSRRAWNEFVRLYEPLLTSYVRARGVPEHDVEDVVQQLNISLWRAMPSFQLDRARGRFRTFLYQMATNAATDYFRKKIRLRKHETTPAETIPEPAAVDPSLDALWTECERKRAYEQARDRVRGTSSDSSWACFERYLLANRTAEEVGAELDMLPNTVRKNASRVLGRIREEAQAFLQEMES